MRIHLSLEAAFALLFAVCVLVALVLLAGCSQAPQAASAPRIEVQGQSVVFPAGSPALARLAIERAQPSIERDLVLPGRLTWNEDSAVRIFPPFGGRVTRILVRAGDRVAAGQALMEIMSADFGQAQSDARKARADLALASRNADRTRDLSEHGVASDKDLQQSEADLERARAESDRAFGRLHAYGHVAEGEARFVVKSPISGTVVERNANPGQEVRSDQSGPPLFVVADPARLWVSLDASESDLRYLKVGMPLFLSSNQFPEDSFAGTLVQLADFVDPASRTVKLRGEVPNPNRALKAEMFVSARVRVAGEGVPTVGGKAVFLEGARRFVFVRAGPNAFARRAVRVGTEVNGRVPVLSGLDAGEEVVVAGGLFLQQMVASAKAVAAPGAAHGEPGT